MWRYENTWCWSMGYGNETCGDMRTPGAGVWGMGYGNETCGDMRTPGAGVGVWK